MQSVNRRNKNQDSNRIEIFIFVKPTYSIS